MTKTRLSATLYLLAVFASGMLVGGVSNRLYMVRSASANSNPPRTMAQYRQTLFSELRTRVGATDVQIAEIDKVLDEAKRRLDALHAEHKPMRETIDRDRVEGIRNVLNEKQRAAYDAWRAERAAAAQAKKKQAQ